jgi:D-serine deaminase-like pyridoxal phosphate-dependent protein
MPTEPRPVTLAEAVRKAVDVCSLSGDSEGLDEFLERFEDADEPIRAIADVDELVSEAIEVIAADDPGPELRMAGAVVVYLAHRRDEMRAEPEELLRLTARAEFDGRPPPEIADWLEDQGVSLP